MHTTEYCNYSGPLVPDSPFCSLTFYETARFRKDLRTGCFLSAGPEERSFVASLANDLDETVAIAECRLLQPCALPGEIEAYGKPVIQIDCVYEEPEHEKDGAAEALISALPDVVKELYGAECHVIVFAKEFVIKDDATFDIFWKVISERKIKRKDIPSGTVSRKGGDFCCAFSNLKTNNYKYIFRRKRVKDKYLQTHSPKGFA